MAKKRYFVLIGIILFLYILSTINLSKTFFYLSRIELPFLAIAICLNFIGVYFKGLRWKFLMEIHKVSVSVFYCAKYFFLGFFLSILTPGRIGDFSRAVYVNKKIKSFGISLATVFLDRLIDIILLLMLGFLAVLSFSYFFHLTIISVPILIGIFLVFLAAIFLVLRKNFVKKIAKPFFGIFVPEKYKQKMKISFEGFYSAINLSFKSKKLLSFAFISGLISWVISVFVVFFLALSLGLNLYMPSLFGMLWFVALVLPIISLLDLLPVSISGIGTREAAVIFLFSFYSIKPELAVAFSLYYLFVGYIIIALIGAVFFMKEPLGKDFLSE